jgi:hypothetical protein
MVAEWLDREFTGLGMPTRLGQLGIARDSLGSVIDAALKNFNADPKQEFPRERALLESVLAACW